MKFAYNTTDPVNAALAGNLAGLLGWTVSHVDPRCQDLEKEYKAVVHDLDFLPEEILRQLLTAAGAGQSLRGIAVHSYKLAPADSRALRSAGAKVGRRLTVHLLRQLAEALRPEKEPV